MQSATFQILLKQISNIKSVNSIYQSLQPSLNLLRPKSIFELQKGVLSRNSSLIQPRFYSSFQKSPPKVKQPSTETPLNEKFDSDLIEDEEDDLAIFESDDEYLLSDSDFSEDEFEDK